MFGLATWKMRGKWLQDTRGRPLPESPGRRKRKVFWCSANRTNRFIAAAGKTVRLFGQGNRGGRISKVVGWEVRRVRGRLEGKDQEGKSKRTVKEGFPTGTEGLQLAETPCQR